MCVRSFIGTESVSKVFQCKTPGLVHVRLWPSFHCLLFYFQPRRWRERRVYLLFSTRSVSSVRYMFENRSTRIFDWFIVFIVDFTLHCCKNIFEKVTSQVYLGHFYAINNVYFSAAFMKKIIYLSILCVCQCVVCDCSTSFVMHAFSVILHLHSNRWETVKLSRKKQCIFRFLLVCLG